MIREARGALSQTQLAKLMGTTQASVSRLEKHWRTASVATLERVAHALGYRLHLELVPILVGRMRHGGSWHVIDVDASTESHIRSVCGLEAKEHEWTIANDSAVSCARCATT